MATFLLTGGRRAEVLGFRVRDVSFDRRTITFRRHEKRPNLKTRNAERVVPLRPQLEGILREYVFGGAGPMDEDALLFPSPRQPGEMITDTRKLLEAIGTLAGFDVPLCRTRVFRHTYCTTRLQTLDAGHPVSPSTVAKELGHGGRSLVDRDYGHLGEIRHRAEHIEHRVDQHEEALGERLTVLPASHAGGT